MRQSTETLIDLSSPGSGLRERVGAYRAGLYAAGSSPRRDGARIPLWPVGVTAESGDFLRDLVAREQAAVTLEVGLGLGLSAMAIVEGLRPADNGASVSHTVIDPDPEYLGWSGVDNLQASGAAGVTTFLKEDSALALPQLVSEGKRFDLAYIDGGHRFEHVMIDVFYALRLVRPGGLILLDDHWMPAVQMGLAFWHTNRGLSLELFDTKGPGKRFVGMRVPREADKRAWDHFVPFDRTTLPEYPWRREVKS